MLKLFQHWPLLPLFSRFLSSLDIFSSMWVFVFKSCYYILALPTAPVSSGLFLSALLESGICLRSQGSFYWKKALETKTRSYRVHCCWCVLIAKPSQLIRKEQYLCIINHVYMDFYKYFYMEPSVSILI